MGLQQSSLWRMRFNYFLHHIFKWECLIPQICSTTCLHYLIFYIIFIWLTTCSTTHTPLPPVPPQPHTPYCCAICSGFVNVAQNFVPIPGNVVSLVSFEDWLDFRQSNIWFQFLVLLSKILYSPYSTNVLSTKQRQFLAILVTVSLWFSHRS